MRMQCLWQTSDASLYDETTKKIDAKHVEELFLLPLFRKVVCAARTYMYFWGERFYTNLKGKSNVSLVTNKLSNIKPYRFVTIVC
jgi:hypothetical protein